MKLFYLLRFFISKTSILVGGQAVIEGVMMRVPGAYATAVRGPGGDIITKRHDFISKTDKYPILKYPFIRGIVGLFESLKIGYSTLQWSADINDSDKNNKQPNRIIEIMLTIISIMLALSLFFVAPIGLTSWLFNKDQDAVTFNIISGFFRIVFFIIYLLIISLMDDVKRLFQYHGAEHKIVYNFESGKKLTISNAQTFPTQHPRCGTSFMFILMLVAMLSFALLDTIIMLYVNKLQVWMRLLLHIPFIPIVSGLGYEVLKMTAKHRNNLLFKILSKPGLWLQNITTKNPNDQQVEIALEALKTAFGNDIKKYKNGKKYLAEAVG